MADYNSKYTGAELDALLDKIYITDFDVASLLALADDPNGGVPCDKSKLREALAANKIILVPYDNAADLIGYAALVGYYEDLIYLKVVTELNNIVIETARDNQDIVGIEVRLHIWDLKQDLLTSGENIKTINSKSILGFGNLTTELAINIISADADQLYVIPNGKVTVFSTELTAGCRFFISSNTVVEGIDNAWTIRFAISAKNTGIYQVTSNTFIKWANGVVPTFENGKYYELSFRLIGQTFLGVWAAFE